MGFFDTFRLKKQRRSQANALYLAVVEQSRQPVLYTVFNVPDTVDGRFDMIVIHVMLLIRRLRGEGEAAAAISQDVLNLMFDDMDRNFREMGISDLSIGKHVKKTAKAFYGRADAIETALEAGEEELAAALRDTVFRSGEREESKGLDLARYLAKADAQLKILQTEQLLDGELVFPSPASNG